jgi:two-component system, OmpR family, response regulator
MSTLEKIKIFLVDDDAVFLKNLEIEFLDHADIEIETFSSGESCVENLTKKPDIVILDYHLDGIDAAAMNGVDTLDKIKAYSEDIAVIMLSSQDSIDVAVNCMHHKAYDYVIKSETAFLRLKKNITNIIKVQKLEKTLDWYMERM